MRYFLEHYLGRISRCINRASWRQSRRYQSDQRPVGWHLQKRKPDAERSRRRDLRRYPGGIRERTHRGPCWGKGGHRETFQEALGKVRRLHLPDQGQENQSEDLLQRQGL